MCIFPCHEHNHTLEVSNNFSAGVDLKISTFSNVVWSLAWADDAELWWDLISVHYLSCFDTYRLKGIMVSWLTNKPFTTVFHVQPSSHCLYNTYISYILAQWFIQWVIKKLVYWNLVRNLYPLFLLVSKFLAIVWENYKNVYHQYGISSMWCCHWNHTEMDYGYTTHREVLECKCVTFLPRENGAYVP